jgi:hypothetical protein
MNQLLQSRYNKELGVRSIEFGDNVSKLNSPN